MSDIEHLRQRLTANGAQVDDHLLPILMAMGGALLADLDALAETPFGGTEPFDPLRWLVADALVPEKP